MSQLQHFALLRMLSIARGFGPCFLRRPGREKKLGERGGGGGGDRLAMACHDDRWDRLLCFQDKLVQTVDERYCPNI
eukprot:32234-Rhodomonas_salina.1